jgi:hypothetical protein
MERRTAPVRSARHERRAPSIVVAAAVVLIVVAIVKPWGSPSPDASPIGAPPRPASPLASPLASPALPSPPSEDALVAPFCLQPSGWRIFAAERWSDRDVRSWRTAEAVSTASGPTDPRIPITPVPSQWILALGYCAPVAGPDRPPADSSITVFRLADEGRERMQVLDLRRLQPRTRPSSLGEVYAPPPIPGAAAGRASGWQDGTYVFRIGGTIGEPFVRWLAVRVEILPPPDPTLSQNPATTDQAPPTQP